MVFGSNKEQKQAEKEFYSRYNMDLQRRSPYPQAPPPYGGYVAPMYGAPPPYGAPMYPAPAPAYPPPMYPGAQPNVRVIPRRIQVPYHVPAQVPCQQQCMPSMSSTSMFMGSGYGSNTAMAPSVTRVVPGPFMGGNQMGPMSSVSPHEAYFGPEKTVGRGTPYTGGYGPMNENYGPQGGGYGPQGGGNQGAHGLQRGGFTPSGGSYAPQQPFNNYDSQGPGLQSGYGSQRRDFAMNEPIDHSRYPGTVVGVSYNVHEPSYEACCQGPQNNFPPSRSMPGQQSSCPPCGQSNRNCNPCMQYGDRIRKLGVPRTYPQRPRPPPPAPAPEPEYEQYVPEQEFVQYQPEQQYEQYQPEQQFEQYEPEQQFEQYQPEQQFEQYQPEQQYEQYEAEPEYEVFQADTDADLRPWFGVGLKWLDNLDEGGTNNVAVVHEVIPGSPADKAGILPEDQIEYWNGIKIDSEPLWKSKMMAMNIGDHVLIGIHRNGFDQQVQAVIEGTSKSKAPKKTVQSSTAAFTDN